MERKISTVIMAAGKGKRMKNPDKSKVMFELLGKPMIQYVIEMAMEIHSEKIIPVVGHQKKTVIDFINEKFKSNKIYYAHQDAQLGTGHAVMQTEPFLHSFEGDVLILSGDVPLLKPETVKKFMKYHYENNFDAALISAYLDDASGYGRIIRDENGNFVDIVEQKDANEEQKKINEINSGIYIIDCRKLFDGLKTLDTNNAQGEYYLTDIFKYFIQLKLKIGAMPVEDSLEISGVNTVEQLAEMEKIIKK
jgi:UDP-N-acetylglucosamine diphosphorylase/glucosamine-1-phosphate N-acetyltransferase